MSLTELTAQVQRLEERFEERFPEVLAVLEEHAPELHAYYSEIDREAKSLEETRINATFLTVPVESIRSRAEQRRRES